MKIDVITQRLQELGINQDHLAACRMPLVGEAISLVDAGLDIFDRPLRLTPTTFSSWRRMKERALDEAIVLQVISAYRSIDYQCDLISRKMKNGLHIDDILKVNAIPGYSEHHTGRALDLTTPDYEPLHESFESSEAFNWLRDNAAQFGFRLSYPRGNNAGIDYEPWHWALKTS